MLLLRKIRLFGLFSLVLAISFQVKAAKPLFSDPVIVKGKGLEIHESDLDEAYVGFKAARAAMGQGMPPGSEKVIREQVLEKLIATKLLLTKATAADRERALQAGFNEYLTKPFEPGELVAVIKRLYDDRHRSAAV